MNSRFRGSRSARRIGAVALGLFVLGYLIGISYWRLEELSSQGRVAVLVGLWALGILALVLLTLAWRMK